MDRQTQTTDEPKKFKILVIRFSSIGDIIQCMSATAGIKAHFPETELHWAVRSDMLKILTINTDIDKIHVFERKSGLSGLLTFAKELKRQNFDLIYDAHKNIRSTILKLILAPLSSFAFGKKPQVIERPKLRFQRFLFFKLKIKNALPMPYRAIESFRAPLRKIGLKFSEKAQTNWQFSEETIKKIDAQLPKSPYVCLVPLAAHEMKRWPVEYFQELIRIMPQQKFVVIGGPQDTFCQEIASVDATRVVNLAGVTSLNESIYVVLRAAFVVSGDTGFLHAADLFRRPTAALLGPTAFGFPTNPEVLVHVSALPCVPCSKDGSGKCSRKIYKECMLEISASSIRNQIEKTLV